MNRQTYAQQYIKTMLNLVSIQKSMLACGADYPADNQARQLALFLYLKQTK